MEAMRLEVVPIRFLQLPGYEGAEETVAVRYRDTALKSTVNVGGVLASP